VKKEHETPFRGEKRGRAGCRPEAGGRLDLVPLSPARSTSKKKRKGEREGPARKEEKRLPVSILEKAIAHSEGVCDRREKKSWT